MDVQWRGDDQVVSQGFAIRVMPEAGAVEPYNIEAHYKILEVVEDTPVPAPRPYWLETDARILGRPFFIMEKVEGEVPIPFGFQNHPIFQDPERHWEMPGIGDPMMDLAWLCLKPLRSDDPNLICMLMEREELYRTYEELTGTKVDEERVYYWEVLAYYKLSSIYIGVSKSAMKLSPVFGFRLS